MKENVLLQKSNDFSLRIVKLCRFLNDQRHEFVISKQVLFNGTSICVQVEEAQQAFGRPDLLQQMAFANKYAFKTNYWLRLLHDSEYIGKPQFESIIGDCEELQKFLSSAVKTMKQGAA